MSKIVKLITVSALSVSFLISCSPVREYTIYPSSVNVEVSSFMEVDSLILFGSFRNASDSLLSMLGRDEISDASVLFRLCGLYSIRAMEDECIAILDSLERAGQDSLHGWKVSLLSLDGRYEEALDFVPEEDALLSQWINARIESAYSNGCENQNGNNPQEQIIYLPPDWDAADSLIESTDTEGVVFAVREGSPVIKAGLQMAILLRSGEYSALVSLCDSVSSAGAPRSLEARSRLFMCFVLRNSGAYASAKYGVYYAFAREYPDHPEARKLAYQVGKYYDNEHEWRAASEAYLHSLNCSGSYAGDERCHWRGGFCAYMDDNYALADSLWSAGCALWGSGFWYDEMKFWRARLASESGDTELAQELLTELADERRWEFYGILASQRLGLLHSVDLRIPIIDPLEYPAAANTISLVEQGYGTQALEMLRDSISPSKAAPVLALMGRYGDCISRLREMDSDLRNSNSGILPDSLLVYYFPAPVLDIAEAASDSLEISFCMLNGIMRNESWFNRNVISTAGARGIIQLMPGTAYDIARWWNLPQLTLDELHDPSLSIPYAALYINRQLRQYDGDESLYLAAYNAGPGNSDRWIDMHGWNPDDPELWIEQVTYRETRMYVKKVLRNYWITEFVLR